MGYTLSFTQITKENIELAGGKGANLGEMSRAGFPIPPGFVLTTDAYRAYVAANNLEPAILAAVEPAAGGNPAAAMTASQTIRRLFENGTLPADIVAEIQTAAAELIRTHGEMPLAVRSSATAEDLPGASFAGQQETYLNVRGETALLQAVVRCWASLWTDRAIVYRIRQGIPPESVSLAVVVQQMIPAEAAGILFTANPVTGARDEIVINAAWGLGEAIVGGLVTPDNVTADKASGRIKESVIAEKKVMTVPTAQGSEESEVPESRRREAVLPPARVAELTRWGREIEQHYGSPQDIEWCLLGDKTYIVQARPITVLPPAPVHWEAPGPGTWVHGGGSLELITEPVSPLGATFFVPRFENQIHALMERLGLADAFQWPMIKTVNNYFYVALDMKLRPTQIPNWIRNFREHLDSIPRWGEELRHYQNQVTDLLAGPRRETRRAVELLERAETLTQAGMTYWIYMMQLVQAVYRKEHTFIKYYNRSIRRPGDPEAEILVRGQETRVFEAEVSGYELARWAESRPEIRAAFDEADPLTACRQTAAGREFLQKLDIHLAKFGHQIYSFDPLWPTLSGDPQPILLAIRSYWQGQEAPQARRERMLAEREAALTAISARLSSRQQKQMHSLLAEARNAAQLRENALFEVGLGWVPLRADLLEIGKRLVAAGTLEKADDIFWLNETELQTTTRELDAGKNPTSLKTMAEERHAQHEAHQGLNPPYILPEGKKAKFYWGWIMPVPELQNQNKGNTLSGLGVSPGKITAVARVIASPAEMERLNQGEILVAHNTTPAWTPIFARAGGLITDMGGPLAHGSIVAREYGIPAVMGVGVATQRIRDGQKVTLDGAAGKVILDESAGWELPDPKGTYARGSITELTPDPLTPLFGTLGLQLINEATEKLYRNLLKQPGATFRNMLVTVNDYLYYRMSFTFTEWRNLLTLGIMTAPQMLRTGPARWDDMSTRYRVGVEKWLKQSVVEMQPGELWQGAQELAGLGIEAYTVLQSSMIPASTSAEALFSRLYAMVRRPGDPPVLTFLVGYENTPIRAEKSLYDLALNARRSPELTDYLLSRPAAEITAQLQQETAPAGIPEAAWAEWRQGLAAHLGNYGHILYDLDFGKPVPKEDPAPLLETVRAYLAGKGNNPYTRQETAKERREAALAVIRPRLKGLQAKYFDKFLGWVEKYAPGRENGLADLGLGWPRLRELLRELGRRLVTAGALAQPDDIFWLEKNELEQAVAHLESGAPLSSYQTQIAQRRSGWQAQHQQTVPPPLLPLREKGFLKTLMDKAGSARMSGHTADEIKGVAASPGRITGTARVLHGPDDFGQMQPGDILVAPITTPAWTPLFALASAIVTDVGGPLSHSSIVAREYGIPAVLGTGLATQRIHSGQTITVDGDTGTVKLK